MSEETHRFLLSSQQRHIWLIQNNSLAYRSVCAVRLTGKLNSGSLRAGLNQVVARHQILRTTFQRMPGLKVPVQVVASAGEVSWHEVDLTTNEKPHDLLVDQYYDHALCTPFNFDSGPLLQVTLLRFSDQLHVLILALAGLCGDAATLENVVNEAGQAYAAIEQGLERNLEEPVQYVEYAGWQDSIAESRHEGTEFPQARFEGAGEIGLPFEKEPASDLPFTSCSYLKRTAPVTKTRLLLACWHTLLWRLTQNPAVVVNVMVRARETEGPLGPLAKSVAIACEFNNQLSFTDVLERLAHEVDRAVAMEQYLKHGDASSTNGAAPISFEEMQWPASEVHGGVSFDFYKQYSCVDRYRLKLTCFHTGTETKLLFSYDPERFQQTDIAKLADYFCTLVENAQANITARACLLELLPESEKLRILRDWTTNETFESECLCFHQAFERQVERTPAVVAVESGDEQFTYDELNRYANRLAHYLLKKGVGPEVRVIICVERSARMLAGVLGILKAGGAYVPLDLNYPAEYLTVMLKDSGAAFLLTTSTLEHRLPKHSLPTLYLDTDWENVTASENDANPVSGATPENLAYVIYTSGSTGRPNGILIRHQSIINLATALKHSVYSGAKSHLRGSLNAPLSFDASVKQLLLLLYGHTLHVLPEEIRRDGLQLGLYLKEQAIDVFDCTPSQLKLLLNRASWEEVCLPPLLLIGGEPVTEETWQTLRALTLANAINVYGPTEATVDATAAWIRGSDRPNIGRPLPNIQVLILDDNLQLVPAGVCGEICIAGESMARGYLNRPALTAEKFIPHPYSQTPGARLYRTGDLARYLPDGAIEFVRRRDQQVKIRGYRIELGEIQALLKSHPMIRDSVVQVKHEASGVNRIFAYVVPKDTRVLMFGDRKPYQLPNEMIVGHLSKHETDYLYKEIFEQRTYLRHGIELYDGDCVFDVGANIGLATLFFHYLRRNLKIFAFEPIPTLFEILKLNTKLHRINATIVPCGLSDRARQTNIAFYPDYSIMSSLYANSAEEEETVKAYIRNQKEAGLSDSSELVSHLDEFVQGRFDSEQVRCELRTLSSILKEEDVPVIDLLKIDVQKSELDVLRGIEARDWEKIRQITMEVHDYEGRLEEAEALLKSKGYTVTVEQDASLKNTDRFHIYACSETRSALRATVTNGGSYQPVTDLGFSIDVLRKYVKKKLPDHMQPAAYFLLEEIPLTVNGKLDKNALPEEVNPQLGGTSVPPRTALERLLSQIWCEVLGTREIGIYDHFFDVGGDSIMQILIVAKANEAGIRLLPKHLIQHPTIAELAGIAEDLKVSPSDSDGRATVQQVVRARTTSSGSLPYTPADFPDANLTEDDLENIVLQLAHRDDGEPQ